MAAAFPKGDANKKGEVYFEAGRGQFGALEDHDQIKNFFSRSKDGPGSKPDFLYNAYSSSLTKTEHAKKRDASIPEGAKMKRVGITLWPSLEARGSYTGPEILDMMKGADSNVKKIDKKATKKREKEENRRWENVQNFLFAVFKGDTEKVEKFIKLGVDVNITIEQLFQYYFQAKGQTLGYELSMKIAATVEYTAKEMLEWLQFPEKVQEAFLLNIKKMQGVAYWSPTPLIWSIIFHHHDIFKMLLNHPDVDLNKIDPSMDATALHEAVFVKNHRAVRRLLACKRFKVADVKSRGWNWDRVKSASGITPLMASVTYSRTEYCTDYTKCLKYIVRSGRNINFKTDYVGINVMRMTKLCNTIHADEYLRLLDQGKFCWLCTDMDESKETRVCRGCRKARYCGLGCQKEDWERHEIYCKEQRMERREERRRVKEGGEEKPAQKKKKVLPDVVRAAVALEIQAKSRKIEIDGILNDDKVAEPYLVAMGKDEKTKLKEYIANRDLNELYELSD